MMPREYVGGGRRGNRGRKEDEQERVGGEGRRAEGKRRRGKERRAKGRRGQVSMIQ